jgi:hypothetical protein
MLTTIKREVKSMGEQSRFIGGEKAPNDGYYMEVGDKAHHTGINDPQSIYLKKGARFPDPKNEDRRWIRVVH